MADGEDQDLKERIQKVRLLDGYMARMWQDVQRAPGELNEDGCSGGPAEGQGDEGGGVGAKREIIKDYFRSGRHKFFPLSRYSLVLSSMRRPKQSLRDRILWSLVSLNGKAEWTELRKRTRLTEEELDAALSQLVKTGDISIIPEGTQGQDQDLILLNLG